MANRTRGIVLRVPVTAEERMLIEQKMKLLRTRNFSAYARKMIIDGYMSIPNMDYKRYRKMRKLVHECCNYYDGNCIALDDGETCVCVQSISYSLLCKWFCATVLPLDKLLCAEMLKQPDSMKRCTECGTSFAAASNRAKYCPSCSQRIRHRKEAERQLELYYRSTHLGG